MSEPMMSRAGLLAWSDGHGLLAKRLYGQRPVRRPDEHQSLFWASSLPMVPAW